VVDKIVPALLQPYLLENHHLTNSPSIGIAVSPEHGHDIKTLLKHADEAMYQAKNSPHSYHAFYLS
jgi:GGDEF domain-containing protein